MAAGYPTAQGGVASALLAVKLTHLVVVLAGELVGQQLKQILRPRLALDVDLIAQLLLKLGTEIQHLAPQIILLAPAHKVGYLLAPLVAVGHV